jgi:hypothetical protein
MAFSMSCGRWSARRAFSGCMPACRQRFGGTWTCHDVVASEAPLRLLFFGIETFGGSALLRNYLPSQDDASKTGRLSMCCLMRNQGRQLNDHQTPQGQVLYNSISGSAGRLVGTILNTQYVRPITPSYGDANSMISSLPVSTSAAQLFVCPVAFQTDSPHTGCQVSDTGSRESIGSCPEIQLDISCVCFFSVKISCDGGYLILLVRLMTIFREEGPIALYKGFVPKVLSLAPCGGVRLLVVEFTLGLFRKVTSFVSPSCSIHFVDDISPWR